MEHRRRYEVACRDAATYTCTADWVERRFQIRETEIVDLSYFEDVVDIIATESESSMIIAHIPFSWALDNG